MTSEDVNKMILAKYLTNRIRNDFKYKNIEVIQKFTDTQKKELIEKVHDDIQMHQNYSCINNLYIIITDAINYFESEYLYGLKHIYNITFLLQDDIFTYLNNYWKSDELERINFLISNLNIQYEDSCTHIVNELYSNFDFQNKLPEIYDSYLEYLNSKVLDYQDYEELILTERELVLVKCYGILQYDEIMLDKVSYNILCKYNINNNSHEENQKILNNSYDVIFQKIKEHCDIQEILDSIEQQKSVNSDLFLNPRKASVLKKKNHYMSFLYQCNSVYSDCEKVIFKEFTEQFLSGYMQMVELYADNKNLQELQQDIESFKRHNTHAIIASKIKEIDRSISFFKIKKNNYKFIPFKELSNKLTLDLNDIVKYINTCTNNTTHINTAKDNFSLIKTLGKEINLNTFKS